MRPNNALPGHIKDDCVRAHRPSPAQTHLAVGRAPAADHLHTHLDHLKVELVVLNQPNPPDDDPSAAPLMGTAVAAE